MRLWPLVLAGCWSGGTAPPAIKRAPLVCPLVMQDSSFRFVRHELFPGCSPAAFLDAIDVRCAQPCTPCGPLDADPLRYERDGQQRLVAITDRAWFRYDARGDLVEIVDTGNNVTQLRYDANHRVLGERTKSGGLEPDWNSYVYEGDRIRSIRGPDGALVRYTYDAAGRLAQTDARAGAYDTRRRYRYDAAGRPTQIASRQLRRGRPIEDAAQSVIDYAYGCD
jgi:YD repeat-containing protein